MSGVLISIFPGVSEHMNSSNKDLGLPKYPPVHQTWKKICFLHLIKNVSLPDLGPLGAHQIMSILWPECKLA